MNTVAGEPIIGCKMQNKNMFTKKFKQLDVEVKNYKNEK